MHKVPFSLSQFYGYKKRLENYGNYGIEDKIKKGGNKKLSLEAETFLEGCVKTNPNVSP